jgi:DNA-binding GntR family transcriptional regulator
MSEAAELAAIIRQLIAFITDHLLPHATDEQRAKLDEILARMTAAETRLSDLEERFDHSR